MSETPNKICVPAPALAAGLDCYLPDLTLVQLRVIKRCTFGGNSLLTNILSSTSCGG
ncbi:hypothetical protein D3C78_1563440 [compost metagenome]